MNTKIEQTVRARYGATALSNLSSKQDGVRAVAEAFGYTGLSCGNPTATANLREGETIVDLGSGGGLDVFLAARKVGATGKAIGIDMTPEMIELARRNAAQGNNGEPYTNVEFHLATIDKLPLPDNSVDCVVSNCVINLAPDKASVFREIARVLKPGGRLAVSDIALKKPLPRVIADDLMAYVGCIAGAISIDDYRAGLQAAGFAHVEIVDSRADLNAYTAIEGQTGCCAPVSSTSMTNEKESLPIVASSCCAPTVTTNGASDCCTSTPQVEADAHSDLAELLSRYDVNEYAASVKVFAVKQGA
ncbi:MAG: hypothetical protein NVSMB56_20070 [Pyrinomonadaceae bacterium]